MANKIIESVVINNKGRVRGNNEDNFFLNGIYLQRKEMDEGAFISNSSEDLFQLYAVCDGMGGADSGEEASYCAVHELSLGYQELNKKLQPDELTDVLYNISEKIRQEALQRGQKSGTTIAMAVVDDGQLCLANVGDSRVYRLRNNSLQQMSVDHSKIQRMMSMGLITPEQARTDPSRHVITQYLGMPSDIKIAPYISQPSELRENDIYLLCSDGLTDMVEDKQIEAVLASKADLKEAAQTLMKAAMQNGGRDNTTIMLLRVKNVADKTEVPGKNNTGLQTVLTAAQAIVGGGILLTIADFVYYILH